MNLLKLYEPENSEFLELLSFALKIQRFDKSVGEFTQSDLFSVLEEIYVYDFLSKKRFDFVYFLLLYAENSIVLILNNLNYRITKAHKMMQISQAKTLDSKAISWIARQDGVNLKTKLSKNKVLAPFKFMNFDTYENRLLKRVLKDLLQIFEARSDLKEFYFLFDKITKFLRSDEAKSINEFGVILYNNILLHHRHYRKISKIYKKLNELNDMNFDDLAKLANSQKENYTKLIFFAKLHFQSEAVLIPNFCDFSDFVCVNFNGRCLENKNLEHIGFFNKTIDLKKNLAQIYTQINSTFDEKSRFIAKNKSSVNEAFADIFDEIPKALNTQIPLLAKAKLNEKFVSANYAHIDDLSLKFYTLKDVKNPVFTQILQDLRMYLPTNKLHYIMNDRLDIFEARDIHANVRLVFSGASFVPRSILVAFDYLLNNALKVGQILLFEKDDLQTIILIKHKKELEKSLTKGLFLEKHPTKNKGEIKKFDLNEAIKITQNEILNAYEVLIREQNLGFKIWGEHLPSLAMEVIKDGEFVNFVLVDDDSEFSKNELKIKEKFEIPSGENSLKIPLVYDNKPSKYEVLLHSPQMPFKENVRCDLTISYDYESENIYTLKFTPENTQFTPFNAQWQKADETLEFKDFEDFYPPKKTWSELNEILNDVLQKLDFKQGVILRAFDEYCFINTSLGDVFCHYNDLAKTSANRGLKLYLSVRQVKKGYKAYLASESLLNLYKESLNRLRPRLAILLKDRSLKDVDMPKPLQDKLMEIIKMITQSDNCKNCFFEPKINGFSKFIYLLNKDMPEIFIKQISQVLDSQSLQFHIYSLAYAVGDMSLKWQKDIFDKICEKFDTNAWNIRALAICVWRDRNLIFKISKEQLNHILNTILEIISVENSQDLLAKNTKNNFIKPKISSSLEILLATIRLKNQNPVLMDKNLNSKFKEAIKNLVNFIKNDKLNLETNLEISVENSKSSLPPLLRAIQKYIQKENIGIKILNIKEEDDKF